MTPDFQWSQYQMDAVIDSTHTHTHAAVRNHIHTQMHSHTLVSSPLWNVGGIRCPNSKKKKKWNIKIPGVIQ